MSLAALDLLGIFVFALSGATLAVQQRLDAFGVLFLAGVAALGGGVARDLLLGVPPAALQDSRYLLAPLVAATAVFFFSPLVERLAGAVRLFDAAGLGLFVAAGTGKSLDAGLGAVPAVAVGCLTGIGGGVLRDVLAGVVPVVLRREVYAVPALVGAAVVTVADGRGADNSAALVGAALLVFALRMVGVWQDWHAPVAPQRRRAGQAWERAGRAGAQRLRSKPATTPRTTDPGSPAMPVHATGYAHVRITVTDIARSRKFYDDVFGFPVAFEVPEGADDATRDALGFLFGGLIYRLPDGQLLGLRPVARPGDAFSEDRVGLDHLALAVSGPDELVAAAAVLDGLGVAHEEIKDLGRAQILEFRDPDGVALELYAAS